MKISGANINGMPNKTFTETWKSLKSEEKKNLADNVKSSVNTLSQIAHGHRNPSERFADAICSALGSENLFPVTIKKAG